MLFPSVLGSRSIVDFSSFFSGDVIAFVSDRSIDFARKDDVLALTEEQKDSLIRHTGLCIEKLPNIKQIHGRRIIALTEKSFQNSNRLQKADGLLTRTANVPLAVRTADCLSIFIFDPKAKSIGLVHAGWRGTRKKSSKTLFKP